MNNKITFVLELLSAGVIASLVAGIFSLVIAVKNNKRLVELENSKQKFTVKQERYKLLKEAYTELINVLPEEKRLGYIITNLTSQNDFTNNTSSTIYKIAEKNMKIMYSHFRKYGYIFSDEEQKEIKDLVEVIDSISISIINISSSWQEKDVESIEDAAVEKGYKKILEKIVKVTEFEEKYFNMFQNNLSKLSK